MSAYSPARTRRQPQRFWTFTRVTDAMISLALIALLGVVLLTQLDLPAWVGRTVDQVSLLLVIAAAVAFFRLTLPRSRR